MKEINASEFKAKCLSLIDEVAASGESILILKRGKPVAQLVPPPSRLRYPQHELFGTVILKGDAVGPALPAEVWDAERGEDSSRPETKRGRGA